jgi:glycerol-3-phosphate dehydrogenase
MKVAVVGGGINGVMSAWALASAGCNVDLFERDRLMGATSSASTKLLHGGLRYLEQGHIRLVREGLRERQWWISVAPHLAHLLELVLPVYQNSQRPRWKMAFGLTLYDALAGTSSFGDHRWHDREQVLRHSPSLRAERLLGAFTYADAQMNDYALGIWAAEQARRAGVRIYENTCVDRVSTNGTVVANGEPCTYEAVVNAGGPWASQLLQQSGTTSRYDLDLVRGSHLIFDRPCERAFVLEVPGERRIGFVLPYEGKMLLGTTEVRQALDDPIECSASESAYLLNLYNHYFTPTLSESDVYASFAGVRPLVRSHHDPTRATREYAIERNGRLITVFGGKWTTSRALGLQVVKAITGKSVDLRPDS